MKRVYGFGGNLDHGQHPSPAKSAQTWTAYSEVCHSRSCGDTVLLYLFQPRHSVPGGIL